MDEDDRHLQAVPDDPDQAVIDAFNDVPEQEWQEPPGYTDAAAELELPLFGSDDFTVWLDGKQPDRGDGPGPQREEWKWWMKCRQRRSGKLGGRPVQPHVETADVENRALELAAAALAGEVVKAAKLLEPYKQRAVTKLAAMLESKDPSDVKFAIKAILEMTDGKPAQTVIEKQDGPHIIEYRTVALMPDLPAFEPGAGVESPGDRLALEADPE